MKKAVFLLICLLLLTAVLCGCNVKLPSNGSSQSTTTEGSGQANSIDNSSSSGKENKKEFKGTEVANAIKVEGENYSASNSEYLILTLNNSSESDCDLEINIDLFDSDDKLIKSAKENVEAFAAGTAVALAVESEKKFDRYEYTLEVVEPKLYQCVDQDLKCDVTKGENKALIAITNNGDTAAQNVKYTALFYKDDELVSHSTGNITDADSEIKPGNTERSQAFCNKDFDDVKVYYHGYSKAAAEPERE